MLMIIFPPSSAISQWMDVQTDILQGKGRLGKAQRTLLYAMGQYPRFPALSTSRYLPVDADTLFMCPRAPPSWYQVCSNQRNPVPSALQVSAKESEEFISAAGSNQWTRLVDVGGVTPLETDGGYSRASSMHVFHNAVTALCIGDM